jgi:hypothetical protein
MLLLRLQRLTQEAWVKIWMWRQQIPLPPVSRSCPRTPSGIPSNPFRVGPPERRRTTWRLHGQYPLTRSPLAQRMKRPVAMTSRHSGFRQFKAFQIKRISCRC